MGKLIYVTNMSLDGYTEDREGKFDFVEPDVETHKYIEDLIRPVGTYLYGRRMYETMAVWETDPSLAAQADYLAEFAAVWQAAHKIVYSRTLTAPSTARTRIEREFDPETVRRLKATSPRDLAIGGPELAAHAFRAGLIDECSLFVGPISVGGGKPALPEDFRLELELLDEHRFGNGMVHLRYRSK